MEMFCLKMYKCARRIKLLSNFDFAMSSVKILTEQNFLSVAYKYFSHEIPVQLFSMILSLVFSQGERDVK